jgi:hypothetical protein
VKPETRYALFILGAAILWKLILLYTGLVNTAIGKYPLLLIFGFLLIGMYRGMEERRKMDHVENLHFPSLFKSGMSIVALFSLTYSLFLYVYLRFIDSGFMTRMKFARMEEVKKSTTSAEKIEAFSRSFDQLPNVTLWILFTFIGLMVLGAFYSGMITRMMRKKYFPVAGSKSRF